MDPILRCRTLLVGAAVLLLALGIVMIFSASAIYAHENYGDSAYFLKRHLVYLMLGGVLALWAAQADLEKLRAKAKPLLGLSLALLVLVLIPGIGQEVNGARRWFKFFGFSFQPSEFLKITMILYMADYLDRKRSSLNDLKKTLMPALLVVGLAAGLIVKQPDVGTAVTVSAIVFMLFIAAGLKFTYLAAIGAAALPVLAYILMSKAYRVRRLLAFLNPWEDPRKTGYQIIQSFVALGSGGLFGVGLGQSQQKLFYLPESHTDFIFSIIGEELGFLGAASVVVLFLVFLFAGMVVVFRSKNVFSQLFCLGFVTLITLEAVINLAVTTGSMPTKGLSLPFISYGGSALLVNMAALGFLYNLATRASVTETS